MDTYTKNCLENSPIINYSLKSWIISDLVFKTLPRGNCTQTGHLEMGRFQTGQFEKSRLPYSELHKLD